MNSHFHDVYRQLSQKSQNDQTLKQILKASQVFVAAQGPSVFSFSDRQAAIRANLKETTATRLILDAAPRVCFIGIDLKDFFKRLLAVSPGIAFNDSCFDLGVGLQLLACAGKAAIRELKKPELCDFQQFANFVFRPVSVQDLPTIYDKITAALKAMPGMELVTQLEMRFVQDLALIESRGISINIPYLQEQSIIAAAEQKRFGKIFNDFGVNPDSGKAVVLYLRNQGIPVDKASNESLEPYRADMFVTQWFAFQKFKFLPNLLAKILNAHRAGRLYPNFIQIGAPTGRMSCHDPCLHSIPRRMKGSFYKPEKGRAISSADYPAIQLRVVAYQAPDQILIECFKKGLDPHTITASKLYGEDPNAVETNETLIPAIL